MFFRVLVLSLVLMPAAVKSGSMHEFHLSKCQIDYNEEEQALQMSLHLFIDDLEEALKKDGKDQLYICTEKEHEEAETYVADYLERHFQLIVDGKPVYYNFIGKEVSEDLQGMWCYLEVESVSSFRRLKISNNILMEVFDDQKNIVSINGPNDKQQYFLFMNGKSEEEATFDQ